MLKNHEWELIQTKIPKQLGRPPKDNRNFIEAIIWILETGSPWHTLPRERFGPHSTVFNRFNRWAKAELLKEIFETIKKKLPARRK